MHLHFVEIIECSRLWHDSVVRKEVNNSERSSESAVFWTVLHMKRLVAFSKDNHIVILFIIVCVERFRLLLDFLLRWRRMKYPFPTWNTAAHSYGVVKAQHFRDTTISKEFVNVQVPVKWATNFEIYQRVKTCCVIFMKLRDLPLYLIVLFLISRVFCCCWKNLAELHCQTAVRNF